MTPQEINDMATAQDVAHITVGLMTGFAAALLIAFALLRPNFGNQLKLPLIFLGVGLAAISAFDFALAFGADGSISWLANIAAVLGAALAAGASGVLAHTAFQSHLLSTLHHRVEAHRRTLDRLRRSRGELERRVKERTQEVHEHEKRLRIALRDSNITVSMQDPDLRYVWMRNAPDGFNAPDIIGKRDEDFLPADVARLSTNAKKRAMETGEDVTIELCIETEVEGGQTRYFDLTTEPYYNDAGELRGLLSVGVETTEKRQREELLKETLREVSHRTKNQLAIMISIARRLAENKPDTAVFLPAFEARLRALSICQDVLVEHDWNVAPLKRLIEAQLEPYVSKVARNNPTILLNGPDIGIMPNSVQNLDLVLHEFALNSYETGALEASAGPLEISWETIVPDDGSSKADTRHLAIMWKEASAKAAPADRFRRGFGLPMAERLAASALGGSLKVEIDEQKPGITARLEISQSSFAA